MPKKLLGISLKRKKIKKILAITISQNKEKNAKCFELVYQQLIISLIQHEIRLIKLSTNILSTL